MVSWHLCPVRVVLALSLRVLALPLFVTAGSFVALSPPSGVDAPQFRLYRNRSLGPADRTHLAYGAAPMLLTALRLRPPRKAQIT